MGCFAIGNSRGAGDDGVRHENGGPETHVEFLISEQGTLPSLDDVPDRDVVQYDTGMRTGELGCEFSGNELTIADEFSRAVRESKFDGFGHELPGRRPFGCRGNMPFCVSHSKADLRVSNASLSFFINCSTVDSREEMVEVEDFSSQDPIPLRVGNSSGGIWGHADNRSSSGDVLGVHFDLFTSLDETGVVWVRRDGIDPTRQQFVFSEFSSLRRGVIVVVGFD